MKKFLFVFLISCFGLTIISCSDEKEEYSATGTTDNTTTTTTDTTAPVIAEVTAVTTPTNDSTPNYTFHQQKQELSPMEVLAHLRQHLRLVGTTPSPFLPWVMELILTVQ